MDSMAGETQQNTTTVYSPKALVSIFEKTIAVPEEKKIIQIKGIYIQDGRQEYNGYYYDHLKDEAADYTLTLIIPTLHRNQLKDNHTILFKAFITRKIDKYGKIEFQMNFVDLVNTTINKFSEEDKQRIEIINAKLNAGIKDLDSVIKQHVYANTKMNIVVLLGRTAIIDNDIKTALGAAVALYNIEYVRVNITNPTEIATKILALDAHPLVELICIARGGGEQMEAFGKPELVKTILNRKKIIASAIGHANDVTLFEQAADKKFITPTAFGNYLKQTYEGIVEELSKSKAKMQKDIQDQLKAIFDGQVKVLNEKFDNTVKLYAQEKKTILDTHETFKRQNAELTEKRVKDLQLEISRSKEENTRINNQLNEARKSGSNSGLILLLIAIIVILIIVLANK
jgi:exodeoxyribonuclease VII large subunit